MKLKGSEIVVEALKREGVELVFGYPGGMALPLYDALYDSGIKHILTRHEQGAVHAADGYARATGKVGVCIATSGPGATNLVTGIATANMDSIPLVCITCQVVTAFLGKDSFQEADVTGITTPITKHNFMVRDMGRLARIMRKAFYIARTGRPGPVVVDIPKDLFDQVMEFNYPDDVSRYLWGYDPVEDGDPRQVNDVVEALSWAHFPVLFVGGGLKSANACEELKAFVEKTNIPVVSTLMGLDDFPTTHKNHYGMVGMHGTYAANMAMMHSDLILAMGVRFSDRVTGVIKHYAPSARIAHFDIDPAEINKNVHVDFRIQGNLHWSLPLLSQDVRLGNLQKWHETIQGWQENYPLCYSKNDKGLLKPQEVLEALDELLDGEAIIATDVGQHQMWAAQYMNFKHPRSFITSGGLGTMGFGLPAAMGAQIGCPEKEVWLISGDGSIMMNCQEMATAAELNIPVRCVILNNRGLGMVRQWQRLFYENRYSCSKHDFELDFAKLAEAMGCTGILVEKREDLLPALEKARAACGPVFLNIRVEDDENVLPMVAPGRALDEMFVHKEEE